MKNFRPLVLWVLIIGIAFALLNNLNFGKPTTAKQQSGVSPQAFVSYAKKTAPSVKKEPAKPLKGQKIITGPQKKSCISEFAVLSGHAQGNLKEKDDYELIPIIFRFGFNLLKGDGGKKMAQFAVEPFASGVTSPDDNAEIGANFLFRFGHNLTNKIRPYIEAGVGVIYITQHTREQSTQFNFTPQAGAGFYYFLNKNLALNAGYRYRHISNCSIKQPNKGINTDMFLVGLSWFY